MVPTRSTRRRVLQGIGAGGTVAILGSKPLAAQEDEGDEPEEEEESEEELEDEFATVRFGHLSPGTPDVDIYLGKTPDLNPTIGDLRYPAFGPGLNDGYLQLPPGTYNVAVVPAGTTDAAIEVEEIELEAGVRYSTLAIGQLPEVEPESDEEDIDDEESDLNGEDEETGEDDDPNDEDEEGENDLDEQEEDETGLQPLVIADAGSTEEATPPEDEAEVSFVHASPDAGPVDITVDGETLIEGVEFADASDYFAVEPGEYEVGIVSDGTEVLSVTRELRPGTSITAYVTGLVADTELEAEPDEEEEDEETEDEEETEEEEEEEETEEEEEETEDEDDEEVDGQEVEEESMELRVVTTLDGTNPLAETVVTR